MIKITLECRDRAHLERVLDAHEGKFGTQTGEVTLQEMRAGDTADPGVVRTLAVDEKIIGALDSSAGDANPKMIEI